MLQTTARRNDVYSSTGFKLFGEIIFRSVEALNKAAAHTHRQREGGARVFICHVNVFSSG